MKILVSPKGNFTGGLQKLPLIPRSQFHTPPAQEQIPNDPFVRRDPRVWKPAQPQHCAGCKRPHLPGMKANSLSGIMMDWAVWAAREACPSALLLLHGKIKPAQPQASLLAPGEHSPAPAVVPRELRPALENSRLPAHTKSCAGPFPTCSSSWGSQEWRNWSQKIVNPPQHHRTSPCAGEFMA